MHIHFSTKLWAGIALILGLLIGGVYVWSTYSEPSATCAMCSFGPVSTFIDIRQNVQFNYPQKLPTQYVGVAAPTQWPPKVTITNDPFSCNEGGETPERFLKTTKKTINGSLYCVEEVREGAAGTLYENYTYRTERKGKLVSLSFALRYPQCMNYEDPQQTACKNEQASFNVDALADSIVKSIQ